MSFLEIICIIIFAGGPIFALLYVVGMDCWWAYKSWRLTADVQRATACKPWIGRDNR